MGIRDVSKAIKRFVDGRRAFLEVSGGPPLGDFLRFDEDTAAYPLGSLGNDANIQFGIRLLRSLGVSTDQGFLDAARQEGQPFNHLNVIVYAGLGDDEFQRATQGLSQRADRCRALLGLYTGGEQVPIIRFKWAEPRHGEAEFLGPRYRGIPNRAVDDPIDLEFISVCATDHYENDQLHYFIGIIEQIYSVGNQVFRIARYFSLLEAMAGAINAQFKNEVGEDREMTRTAIRFMVGYFLEFDVPRFTIEPDRDFEFDHIELAGQVRNKLFHGGGDLSHDDVSKVLHPGVDLLREAPDMISHRLRRDCELEIARWARRDSRGWLAQNGEVFEMAERDSQYDGRKLTKPLVTKSAKTGAIGSVYAKVPGNETAIVRLRLTE